VVVGGGGSAAEYALFCAKISEQVMLIHRRDGLRASKIFQDRLFSEPKIKILWNTVVEEIFGGDRVEDVVIRNVKTGERLVVTCEAIFIAIGHIPDTKIFTGWLELDENGYIITRDLVKTSVEGVFVAGKVMDKRCRRAVSSAGFRCIAALEAIKCVGALKKEEQVKC